MSVQVTIVGLGQIGTSIGLALADHREMVRRVGHDREVRVARQAEKMGALDKVSLNLPSAVREADLVLLSLPIDQIRDTLSIIVQDLREGAVIMDTAPVKRVVAGWIAEQLPPERYYVGLTPILNPIYLHSLERGVQAGRGDLFRDGLMAIVTPQHVPADAIKLAADLTRLIGATPLFADPLEMDGLMASTHIVPQLMAAALLDTTVDRPGWNEGRKVAGRDFALVSAPILNPFETRSLREAAMSDRENVVRVLDNVVASLQAMRAEIDGGQSTELDERLNRVRQGRETWWQQRLAASWSDEERPPLEAPTASEVFGRLVGMGGKKKT
jgi:prephenate dehydrogenase